MLSRLACIAALTCGVLTVAAFLWRPDRWEVPAGVVGGGALAGIAYWGLLGVARGLGPRVENGENAPNSRGFALVKFFTRHVILATVAYVMMVRLHLDPVAMLVGVTSVVVAVAFEATRPR